MGASKAYLRDVPSLVKHIEKQSPVPIRRTWWAKYAWKHMQLIESEFGYKSKSEKMDILAWVMNSELNRMKEVWPPPPSKKDSERDS